MSLFHRKRHALIIAVALAAVLLAGLKVASEDAGDRIDGTASTSLNAGASVFSLIIDTPKPGEPFPVFKVTEGDRVTFEITSDRVGEVNVHGYERQVSVSPGQQAMLTFVAEHAGHYPLHLHELADPNASDSAVMHRHLAILEIQPR